MKHRIFKRSAAVLMAAAAIFPAMPSAHAVGVTVAGYTSTRDFIQLNLYDYNSKINERWTQNKKYPGFQWNGGAYEGTRGTGLYIVDAIDFGNSKITDYAYSGKNHGKSSTSTAVGNAGGEINKLDTSAGVTNRPIGMSRGRSVMENRLLDGYPALADGTSLSWLFSENEAVSKMNTETIDGLFLQDEESGNYSYDSRENHAQYSDNFFTRYEEVITPNFIVYPFGNFLPMNDINAASPVSGIGDMDKYISRVQSGLGSEPTDAQLAYMLEEYKMQLRKAGLINGSAAELLRDFISSGKNDSPGGPADIPDSHISRLYNIDWDDETNFFFGMDMSMNFMMAENGLTGKNNDTPMVFSFSGDDDVWVYVDGALFLDLSGIHRHVGGKIDFVNGMVHYYGLDEKTGDVDMEGSPYASFSFAQLFEAAEMDDIELNSKGTFKDHTNHELKFYYMERGSGSSVCSISFNFPLLPQTGPQEGELPEAKAQHDNDACMAYLSIPGLELELPVMSRWSYEKLEHSPCRYSGSIAGGDLVILAHSSELQFGGIRGLEPGDELILTDSEGESIRYKAAVHEQIEAWEGEKLCSGDYELSLLTCTEDGRARHVLRFERA